LLGGALSGAALLPAPPAHAAPRLIRPPRLRRGDLVGLIAPGGAMEDAQVERAVASLESFGMRVRVGDNIRLRRGNYAGTPFQQAQDFHEMMRDRAVKAIWCGRGGSGGSLLLPLLDYRLIRSHAKVIIGYSDFTAMLLAISRLAGIVTFHGPVGISTFSEYTSAHLRAVLMEPRAGHVMESARGATTEPPEGTLVPGVATGPLVGGNLSVLTALVGTPYAARMRGAVAFLEDIDEAPYRINRMLTQLVQSGDLKHAAGIMFGKCWRCRVPEGEATLSLEETLRDRFEPLRVPAAIGLSFGHNSGNFTLPIGVRARFDATERTVTLLEPAVS
jgi:muramoyltetrapeptide carboxypeptidase